VNRQKGILSPGGYALAAGDGVMNDAKIVNTNGFVNNCGRLFRPSEQFQADIVELGLKGFCVNDVRVDTLAADSGRITGYPEVILSWRYQGVPRFQQRPTVEPPNGDLRQLTFPREFDDSTDEHVSRLIWAHPVAYEPSTHSNQRRIPRCVDGHFVPESNYWFMERQAADDFHRKVKFPAIAEIPAYGTQRWS
jgi:hypothetical protein